MPRGRGEVTACVERVVSCVACLLPGLGAAATAQAKACSPIGGGGPPAIGGLPLPARVFPTGVTGTVFRPPVGGSIQDSNPKPSKLDGPARLSITDGSEPQGRI